LNQSNRKVFSPLVPQSECELLSTIPVDEIVSNYHKILPKVNVSRLLQGHAQLSLYKCCESEYEFYWPFETAGDDQFYAELSSHDWYYQDWKWEHEAALKHIENGQRVLEVGAGSGSFLKKLKSLKEVDTIGLEFNADVKQYASNSGVNLIDQSIQEFSKNHKGEFDVVCSFQVLEHVAEVRSFLKSMIECLKPSGILIIGVPNNDSFIGSNAHFSKVLNMPPHHMGKWSSASLSYLKDVFAVELLDLEREPLQDLHFETFLYNRLYKIFGSSLVLRVLYKLRLVELFRRHFKKRQSSELGHSINAYYRKR
jgi:2-polyprenyl-3-methyl-5-hydroxy-6-metoxy-1,4-benzoquinol methylase